MSDAATPDTDKSLMDEAALIATRVATQWTSFGKFWRGGWRSTAGWALVLTILVNGVILPMARLWGFQGEALDWTALGAFLVAFVGLVKFRSDDLKNGTAS